MNKIKLYIGAALMIISGWIPPHDTAMVAVGFGLMFIGMAINKKE